MPLPNLQEPLALLEQQDLAGAVDVLERKVAALPAHLAAHVLLAYAYEAQRRWDRALKAWEEARFLMPNSPIAETGKRRVLRRMDGIEEADEPGPAADRPNVQDPPASPPTPNDSSPPIPEASVSPDDEDTPSSAAEADELAQLRRQAEREARQGGARSGMSPPSPPADPSSPESDDALPDPPSSTPEEQVEEFEADEAAGDLDRLIDELQSARIEPDPEAADAAPEAEFEPPEPDEAEEIVSETLARIHENQEDYAKAGRIYAKLAEQEPDRADELQEKAAEMREKADAMDDAPDPDPSQ